MFELDYDTKYISVVMQFEYHSTSSKDVPNDVRRAFMGLDKGSPKIPQKIRDKCNYDREILYPIHFSLIKKPVKIDLPGKRNYKVRNTAVGSIILYEYLGLPEDYKSCCIKFNEFLKEQLKKKTPKYFNSITDIKFIIGFDLKDVAK